MHRSSMSYRSLGRDMELNGSGFVARQERSDVGSVLKIQAGLMVRNMYVPCGGLMVKRG